MASRTSTNYDGEFYTTSRRGRPSDGDFGYEMFSGMGKYERTPIIEPNPAYILDDEWRKNLKDYGPVDSGLFESEMTRRTTNARNLLNLREYMSRSENLPYSDSDYNLSFADPDPRGTNNQPDFNGEFRRQQAVRVARLPFKDDGDYSEASGGNIHPNTMNKLIRSSQNWLKARLKIFDISWENLNNGGVGVYPNVSKVYSSAIEDETVLSDGQKTNLEKEVAQHHNINISNIVNMGSKFLRANTTTDQLVKVGPYNKLYKNRGLINHENALRIIEDDTPWSVISGVQQAPKNLVKLMANQIYSDSTSITPYTAIQMSRILQQQTEGDSPRFKNIADSNPELNNRSINLTKNILSLLGFSDQDIKYLESKEGKNSKAREHMLADLQKIVETTHALPANIKLQLQNELILGAAGKGLAPGSSSELRDLQNQVVVNPKIVEFMHNSTQTSAPHANTQENRHSNLADPEDKLKHIFENNPLFVYKTPGKATEDLTLNRYEAEGSGMRGSNLDKKAHSYTNLKKFAARLENNRNLGQATNKFFDSFRTQEQKHMRISDTDLHQDRAKTEIEHEMMEARYLDRHTAKIGSKMTGREVQRTHIYDDAGDVQNIMSRVRTHPSVEKLRNSQGKKTRKFDKEILSEDNEIENTEANYPW